MDSENLEDEVTDKQEHYYSRQEEPALEDDTPKDAPKAPGGPWSVYWNPSNNQCLVAKNAQGYHHRHGPTTWQNCWSWIDARCTPAGGGFQC